MKETSPSAKLVNIFIQNKRGKNKIMKLSIKHNVKILLLSTALLVGIDANVMASIVTFDNTTPNGSPVYYGSNVTYTEQGLNITSTNNSTLIFNPFNQNYGGTASPGSGGNSIDNNPNGTSFAQDDGANLTLSASTPFSLQSLQVGTAYSYYFGTNSDSITLTGYVDSSGGCGVSAILTCPGYIPAHTISDTLNIAAGTEWSNISLTGWDNLSSVVISGTSNSYSMFVDSIVFNQPAAVPVPGAVWLFGSALVGLMGFIRRKTIQQ